MGPSSAGGALGKRPAAPVKEEGAPGKRKAVEPEPDDDDEVMEQAAPANPMSTSAPAAADDDDDELQYQGHTGAIALADFPHARENCVSKPFRFGAEQQHCANCYCYVCDDLASKCPQWDSHCAATHTKPVWQQARQAWKTKDAPARGAGGGGAHGARAPALVRRR